MLPSDFYKQRILTLPLDRLVAGFPEFAWRQTSRGFAATNEGTTKMLWGVRPDRVEARRRASGGVTVGVVVHGDSGGVGKGGNVYTWIWLHTRAFRLDGPAYTRAVIEIAERVGVDHSEISAPRCDLSPAERAQRELDEAQMRERWQEAQAEQAAADLAERNARRLQASMVWDQASMVADDVCPAWLYLMGRLGWHGAKPGQGREDGTIAWRCPSSIRAVVPGAELAFEYQDARKVWRGPALVASITGVDGRVIGVQIIPLERFGSTGGVLRFVKREMEPGIPAKPIYGTTMDEQGRGGRVVMGHSDDGPLVLCEGVETAWALYVATGWRVWACLSTAGLAAASIEGCPNVHQVIVAGDHDEPSGTPTTDPVGDRPGHRAAWAAARRIKAANPAVMVQVAIPDDHGLRKGHAVGAAEVDQAQTQDQRP